MSKIRFNTIASSSGAYELSYNPSHVELNDDSEFGEFEVIDDGPVIQRSEFDGRLRRLVWPGGIRVDDATMAAQIAVLRGYVGTIRYVNFDTAWYADAALASTWHKHRIVNFLTKLRDAQAQRSGTPKYDSIELIISPEA